MNLMIHESVKWQDVHRSNPLLLLVLSSSSSLSSSLFFCSTRRRMRLSSSSQQLLLLLPSQAWIAGPVVFVSLWAFFFGWSTICNNWCRYFLVYTKRTLDVFGCHSLYLRFVSEILEFVSLPRDDSGAGRSRKELTWRATKPYASTYVSMRDPCEQNDVTDVFSEAPFNRVRAENEKEERKKDRARFPHSGIGHGQTKRTLLHNRLAA